MIFEVDDIHNCPTPPNDEIGYIFIDKNTKHFMIKRENGTVVEFTNALPNEVLFNLCDATILKVKGKNFTQKFDLSIEGEGRYYVDWGDGKSSAVEKIERSIRLEHTYEGEEEMEYKIYIWFSSSNSKIGLHGVEDSNYISEIISISDKLSNISGLCKGSLNLTTLPKGFDQLLTKYNCDEICSGCINLLGDINDIIPENNLIQSIRNAFSNCRGLTLADPNLLKKKLWGSFVNKSIPHDDCFSNCSPDVISKLPISYGGLLSNINEYDYVSFVNHIENDDIHTESKDALQNQFKELSGFITDNLLDSLSSHIEDTKLHITDDYTNSLKKYLSGINSTSITSVRSALENHIGDITHLTEAQRNSISIGIEHTYNSSIHLSAEEKTKIDDYFSSAADLITDMRSS